MPKTNADMCREYRQRKKAAENRKKKTPKTSTERVREFRERQQSLRPVCNIENNLLNMPDKASTVPNSGNEHCTSNIETETNMDNDELEIRDMVEIKEEVIQEIDLTNFLFDEEQDDNRVGSSAGIMKANMCRTTDEEVDDTAKHVCKCKTTFKRRSSLEKHLKYCRLSSEYHLRKAEMLKNLEHIEINAAIMEAKNICFCCEESYAIESFHIGQIKCTDCLKSFKSQMSFERHIFISHSELNDFPCTICNAKLRSEILLKLHVNQHKKCGKLYACKICNKEFNCADYLKRHQTMSMCSQKKPLKCKECKKTFFGLDNIRAHIRSYHLGLQSSKKMEFVCTICKKSLSSAHNLNVHLRVHTGESPFDCDLCDKKFRSLELLRRHRPHHTGEKPYVCKECQRPFGTASNLSRHMKQHTGERPHVCSVCKKSYITKPQINRHMKTHLKNPHIKCAKHNNDISNEAAVFKCSVCQDPFWTKRHLDNHMELGCSLKYNERTDCTICKKNFDNSTTLRFHLTMVHKVDPEDYIKIGTNNDTETVVQPVVYILEGKNASKPANTEIANDYDSVVISSVIYKCENDPSNEIIFNRATDNIKIVDDDGNDLEESSSNENNCNINTCNSDDDVDEEDSKSLKCFIYEEDLSEEIKFNIITDIPSDNVDDKSGVKLAEEFKVDGIQSSISIVHSDAEFVNDENVVDANIIEIKEESS